MFDVLSYDGILFLINNLFRIYIVYRFLGIFFDRQHVNRKWEIAAYLLYYVVHSSLYLMFNILPLTMITNVAFMYALSFLYKSRMSTKVVVVLLVYATGLCVEGLAYAILLTAHYSGLHMTNMVLLLGSLMVFLIVLSMERVQASRRDLEIKSKNWVALLLIPVASVFISLVLGVPLTDFHWITLALLCLLLINFIAFYLYDALARYYVEENEKQLLIQQNEAYVRQFELIQQSQENLRMFRHDIKNHMLTLHALISKEDRSELEAYLKNISRNIETETSHVNTGNPYVDGILNYKIEEALRMGANVNIDINIPQKLNIEAFDLNVILGNLLDNAIEGIRGSENKNIHIEMALDRSMLFIRVWNHFVGNLKRRKGEFLSTKGSSRLRGLGLRSVQSSIGQYDGTLDVETVDGVFMVTVLLYNQKHTYTENQE